jgi:hypothetical protein
MFGAWDPMHLIQTKAGTQFDLGEWSRGWEQVVGLLRLIGRTQVWVAEAGGGLGASVGAGFGLSQA